MADGPPSDAAEFRTLGGRRVVIGMLLFGVVMVSAMGLYWELYTRPFRPLQEAIHAEFPGSTPRVIGGQHKSHKNGSPSLLRIVVQVDFDPDAADAAAIDHYIERLRTLASEMMDLSPYDELEIHLVQRVPESETRQRSFRFPLAE